MIWSPIRERLNMENMETIMSANKEAVCRFIGKLYKTFGSHAYGDQNLIFRGEPEEYKTVKSSLLRKIEENVKYPAYTFDTDSSNRTIAREASPYFGGDIVRGRELEAIATLQHYGAPTPLIDFSLDWRIALYFACEKLEYKCGRIIFFSCESAKSRYDLSVQKPSGHHHDNAGQMAGRQIDQQSVLVWSENGGFKPDACHIKPVPRKYKPGLLAWLRSQGIHRESVYRDVHGYVGLIHDDVKAWSLIHVAERLIEEKKFKLAEDNLKILIYGKRSIKSIEQKGKAFFLLGQSIEKQSRYKDALRHYEKACSLLLHSTNGVEPRLATAGCLKALNKNDCVGDKIGSIEYLWTG